MRRMEVKCWMEEMSEELLQAMVRHPGLKELDIWGTILSRAPTSKELSSANPTLLAQAVTQMKEVDLSFTNLTTRQIIAIFTAMTGSSHLKTLKLAGNNLSSVDTDLLAQAVNQLETVNIRSTQLTRQQRTMILTKSLLTSNLKEIHMQQNGQVGEELRRQAMQVINKLYV